MTWHGSVVASGFVFDTALISRAELVARLAVLWRDGARLSRRDGHVYLVGLAPRRVDSRTAPGTPLVERDGRWLAAPADAETLRGAPRDAVVERQHGRLVVTPWTTLEACDPSELVELELPPLETNVSTLEPPPVATVLATVENTAPTVADVFAPMLARLRASAPAPAQLAPPRASWRQRLGRFLGSLRLSSSAKAPEVPPAAAPPRPSWWQRLGRFFGSLRLPSSAPAALPPTAAPPPPSTGAAIAPSAPSAPSGPSWVEAALGDLFAKVKGLFAERAKERQRQYLDELRERFERGELFEALHHAIPIGDGLSTGISLSVPGRQATLSLFATSSPGPAIVLERNELDGLRKVYREAFDKLVAEGKIEEAAYLQAQLLRDVAAAVALLEQHGKIELAAQLGAAHRLPDLELVRLWLAAKRPRDAVLVARRANAFAAAVAMLETRSPPLALELREHWGRFLAERGRWADALEATAPMSAPPQAFDEWLARAGEAGGASAATALALTVAKQRQPLTDVRRRLDALLDDDESPANASAAASALLRHAPGTAAPLHRDLWRRLVSDAGNGRSVDRSLVDKVLAATADEALKVDAVTAPTPQAVAGFAPTFEPSLDERGTIPIVDAAELIRGRTLVALGAAGLAVVSREGATLRHLAVKADALVTGAPGMPVLVVARDGALTRVSRLDAHTLEVRPWFQAMVSACAPRHDGYFWAVGLDDALVVLDVQASGPMEWWRVPGFRVSAVGAGGPHFWAHGHDVAKNERAGRAWLNGNPTPVLQFGADSCGWATGKLRTWAFDTERVWLRDPRLTTALSPGAWSFRATAHALLGTRVFGTSTELYALDWNTFAPRCLVRLAGTRATTVRELESGLLVGDEHGRLLELAMPSGEVRRMLRV